MKNKTPRRSDSLFSDIFLPQESLRIRAEAREFADDVLIENARNLYQKAAINYDRGNRAQPLMAMAKIAGSELAVNVTRDAIQACGGYGFARRMNGDGVDWPLESIYRDAKIGEIYEGANEIQRWAIARDIFGRELTG